MTAPAETPPPAGGTTSASEAAPAPWFADVAPGPAPESRWLRAADGVRLRVAHWPEGTRGTVLLFPGRTEHVEKYAPLAEAFTGAGWQVAAIDWRGQGLADRLAPDPLLGHVDRFPDYQRDVAALTAFLARRGAPRPWHLLAHSMGGMIALRALHDGLPVTGVVFSAPMWDLPGPGAFALALKWAIRAADALGLSLLRTPTTGPRSYVLTAPFADNTLTRDREMWDWMGRMIRAHPELEIGGASIRWVAEALREAALFARLDPPPQPAVTFLGSDEQVVDPVAVRRHMARWGAARPGARLIEVPAARHEIFMELPPVRQHFIATAIDTFARAEEG